MESHVEHRWNPSSSRAVIRMLLAILGRCGLTSLIWSIGFGSLAFFARSERVATKNLLIEEGAATAAFDVGCYCFLLFFLAALLAEPILLIVSRSGRLPELAQLLGSILYGGLGAFFSFFLFQPNQPGPKTTMLVTGGALVGFLGSGIQAALWSLHSQDEESDSDLPFTWYVLFILLSATVLGAMHGWTGTNPLLKDLLQYREARAAKSATPDLPAQRQVDSDGGA